MEKKSVLDQRRAEITILVDSDPGITQSKIAILMNLSPATISGVVALMTLCEELVAVEAEYSESEKGRKQRVGTYLYPPETRRMIARLVKEPWRVSYGHNAKARTKRNLDPRKKRKNPHHSGKSAGKGLSADSPANGKVPGVRRKGKPDRERV